MLLMIDNYDSFTYNLVQYFAELGEEVLVRRHDEVSIAEIEALDPAGIVISPGPCTPNEAGISNQVIRHFSGKIALFGVCLGLQCMAAAFGGRIIRAGRIMHGKMAQVHHDNTGVFRGLPNPLKVIRYHSLVVDPKTIPEGFEVTAWAEDPGEKVIMGLRHRTYTLEGVQFHPESFLSECGHRLFTNFLDCLPHPAEESA